jgi:hypothetical protein
MTAALTSVLHQQAPRRRHRRPCRPRRAATRPASRRRHRHRDRGGRQHGPFRRHTIRTRPNRDHARRTRPTSRPDRSPGTRHLMISLALADGRTERGRSGSLRYERAIAPDAALRLSPSMILHHGRCPLEEGERGQHPSRVRPPMRRTTARSATDAPIAGDIGWWSARYSDAVLGRTRRRLHGHSALRARRLALGVAAGRILVAQPSGRRAKDPPAGMPGSAVPGWVSIRSGHVGTGALIGGLGPSSARSRRPSRRRRCSWAPAL